MKKFTLGCLLGAILTFLIFYTTEKPYIITVASVDGDTTRVTFVSRVKPTWYNGGKTDRDWRNIQITNDESPLRMWYTTTRQR